ncbi:MAG: ABC transporter ATP-binding protein [Actinomycetota bacterium]|nr:ABC transporter ATP-binding protein [Actinomycetota bacterium]
MSQAVIKTTNLTKYYGKTRGIIDVNLEVLSGEVFGYLGPNGAGKSTTIRLLLDLIRPMIGSATIFGFDVNTEGLQARNEIGYVPGELALYEEMTAKDLIIYFGRLRGGVDWAYVNELAERLDLDITRRIGAYSSGNKQKLGLVQAFMNSPRLLILDEPTKGLDPLVQHEFYRMISEFKRKGRTVFLSSHIMPEVEKICDRVGVIREGRLITVKEISELKAVALRSLEIHFASPITTVDFMGVGGVQDLMIDNKTLRCKVKGSLDPLIKRAAQFEVVNLITHEPNLEEIFLDFYEEEEADVS